MKPCTHCGHALTNAAQSCSKCGTPWENRVQLNPKRPPDDQYPRYTPWPDLLLTVVLAAIGFYFFGLLGAFSGLALGAIITLGF